MNPSPSPKLTSKLSVFLSYRSVEARFADVLKQHLIRDFIGMVDVFLASDTTSIPAGSSWHAGILEGLHRADLHIVICSSFSVQCPWINYEAGAAAVQATPIVPLCHSGLLPHQLPVPLSESEGGIITDAITLGRVYGRIAGLIGSAVPDVDFDKLAQDFIVVQQQLADLMEHERAAAEQAAYATSDAEPESIKRPRVICVTSPQFKELGYANQLSLVLGAFPETIEHQFVLNSTDLKAVLLDGRQVHIVHIAAFVCPRGGDIYFTPVKLPLGDSAVDEPDLIRPEALVSLLERAKTRLVVLGASASLVLGAQLLPVANVIAVRDMVSARAMASWVETFYKTLMKEPLPAAFDLATQVSQAPMRLYAQQRHVPSLKLAMSGQPAAVL
jgi:TIR domain